MSCIRENSQRKAKEYEVAKIGTLSAESIEKPIHQAFTLNAITIEQTP